MKITFIGSKLVSFEEIAKGTVFKDPRPKIPIISKPPQWSMKIVAKRSGIVSVWTITLSIALLQNTWFIPSTMRNSSFLDKPNFCSCSLSNDFCGCV